MHFCSFVPDQPSGNRRLAPGNDGFSAHGAFAVIVFLPPFPAALSSNHPGPLFCPRGVEGDRDARPWRLRAQGHGQRLRWGVQGQLPPRVWAASSLPGRRMWSSRLGMAEAAQEYSLRRLCLWHYNICGSFDLSTNNSAITSFDAIDFLEKNWFKINFPTEPELHPYQIVAGWI